MLDKIFAGYAAACCRTEKAELRKQSLQFSRLSYLASCLPYAVSQLHAVLILGSHLISCKLPQITLDFFSYLPVFRLLSVSSLITRLATLILSEVDCMISLVVYVSADLVLLPQSNTPLLKASSILHYYAFAFQTNHFFPFVCSHDYSALRPPRNWMISVQLYIFLLLVLQITSDICELVPQIISLKHTPCLT